MPEQLKQEQLYISTICTEAAPLAREYGLGLELAEYCTAYNMDRSFVQTDAALQEKLGGISQRVLHAPFNELFPCAIDPEARALAVRRYRQALVLAAHYHAQKVVIHAGYMPFVYYSCWFETQSTAFWREFLQQMPENITICLENVLETQPELLLHVVETVGDARLRLCLDVGHVNVYAAQTAIEWLRRLSPYLSHFHLHNNRADSDTHSSLSDGTIPMAAFLGEALALCPEASFTLETTHAEDDLLWLQNKHLLCTGSAGIQI